AQDARSFTILSLPTNTCHPEGAQRLKDLVSSRVRVGILEGTRDPLPTQNGTTAQEIARLTRLQARFLGRCARSE
ncbi:MAG: hypothetical protein MKZ95_06610, partial [Pirellulales bacterium]|nr:hypothetical protein [Pirellulales bacterium]